MRGPKNKMSSMLKAAFKAGVKREKSKEFKAEIKKNLNVKIEERLRSSNS